jgi:hypothetical protein
MLENVDYNLGDHVVRIQLHKDLVEQMHYDKKIIMAFLEDLFEIHVATILVTCTVYLRRECATCLMARLTEQLMDWVNTKGYKHLTEDEDVPQFQRQVAIFTKELAEQEMTHPCTEDAANIQLH